MVLDLNCRKNMCCVLMLIINELVSDFDIECGHKIFLVFVQEFFGFCGFVMDGQFLDACWDRDLKHLQQHIDFDDGNVSWRPMFHIGMPNMLDV